MSRHKTELDLARDDLMSHIHRCGVLQATEEQQTEWMNDTVEYLGERFATLSPEQLNELREIGMRFCSPVIPHGKNHTALTQGETAEDAGEVTAEDAGDRVAEHAVNEDAVNEDASDAAMAGAA